MKRHFEKAQNTQIDLRQPPPTKKQKLSANINVSNVNNSSTLPISITDVPETYDDEFEFDQDNESNWSDCDVRFTDSDVSLSNKPIARTPSTLTTQYWLCIQCKELNNLKDTFSKYDMKCFRCDCRYNIKSKVISLQCDAQQSEQTAWKCTQCTFCNTTNINQCEMCQTNKLINNESKPVTPFKKKYCAEYSTSLVRGYLRALCPFNSTIPEILSIVVLKFYQFCNFWNVLYLKSWDFEEAGSENGHIMYDKSTLILKHLLTNETHWVHAYSSQRVEYLGDYSWTLQIQNIGNVAEITDTAVCWIGVVESDHRLGIKTNDELFCSTSSGFGVCGEDGHKMCNNLSKPFGNPFKINDIITVKLQCTRSYYELLFFVNGKNMNCNSERQDDCNNVAFRLPNDKVYEMTVALRFKYKIKCISFNVKPYL